MVDEDIEESARAQNEVMKMIQMVAREHRTGSLDPQFQRGVSENYLYLVDGLHAVPDWRVGSQSELKVYNSMGFCVYYEELKPVNKRNSNIQ